MRVPGGGASWLGVGCPGSGALPPPTTRPFGPAAGAHYPLAVGAGAVGLGTRDQPHNARSCELALRAVERPEGARGGAPDAWVWGFRRRALSPHRPLVRSSVRPGPTTHWLWVRGCGHGDPSPTPQRALLRAGFARCGGGMWVPGGGRLLPGSGASGVGRSPGPRPLVGSGVRLGPTTHWLWVRGVQAWGPVTNPAAHALASWLCALWGRHEGARGGRLLPGCGASGDRRSPGPNLSSVRACIQGPTTHWLWVRGVRAWGPITNPTARALASWLCALSGRHEGARGGRLLPGCGASGDGRSPTPDLSSVRACGRGPLPTGVLVVDLAWIPW